MTRTRFRRHLNWILAVTLLLIALPHVYSAADLTQRYLHAYRHCAFSDAQIQALRGYTVLLVPGYLSALYPEAYADHIRWLRANGVFYHKIAVTSGDSAEVNGAIIGQAIREAPKPVILITHSKGSVDALHALLSDANTRTKVKGWISLQGAFLGSPVADQLLNGSRINPLFATIILGFFGGTRESARALTTTASRAFYQTHATAISRLLQEVPTIAFASALDAKPGTQPATTLELPYDMMAREGIRSDGLIPLDAASLPGMDVIKISGIDHVAPILPAQVRYDRIRMMQALLLTLRIPFRELAQEASCKGPH